MIEVFPSNNITPQQALLQLGEDVDVGNIDQVAIVYIRKGENAPRLTCSSMSPSDMNFLGFALQHYSLQYLNE